MGNTCTPMADSCQCMAKPLSNQPPIKMNKLKKKEGWWIKTTETGMKYLLPSSNTAKTTLSLTKETDICKLDHLGAGK